METPDQLETAREIEELTLDVANLRMQLTYSEQQNRTLRVRTNRYERILGMEDAA